MLQANDVGDAIYSSKQRNYIVIGSGLIAVVTDCTENTVQLPGYRLIKECGLKPEMGVNQDSAFKHDSIRFLRYTARLVPTLSEVRESGNKRWRLPEVHT